MSIGSERRRPLFWSQSFCNCHVDIVYAWTNQPLRGSTHNCSKLGTCIKTLGYLFNKSGRPENSRMKAFFYSKHFVIKYVYWKVLTNYISLTAEVPNPKTVMFWFLKQGFGLTQDTKNYHTGRNISILIEGDEVGIVLGKSFILLMSNVLCAKHNV